MTTPFSFLLTRLEPVGFVRLEPVGLVTTDVTESIGTASRCSTSTIITNRRISKRVFADRGGISAVCVTALDVAERIFTADCASHGWCNHETRYQNCYYFVHVILLYLLTIN